MVEDLGGGSNAFITFVPEYSFRGCAKNITLVGAHVHCIHDALVPTATVVKVWDKIGSL